MRSLQLEVIYEKTLSSCQIPRQTNLTPRTLECYVRECANISSSDWKDLEIISFDYVDDDTGGGYAARISREDRTLAFEKLCKNF